jgi:hypothetical protein
MKRNMLVLVFLGVALFVASRFCRFREAHAATRGAVVDSVDGHAPHAIVPDESSTETFVEPSATAVVQHLSPRPRPTASIDRDDPPPWPAPVGALPSAWR